MSKLYGYVGAVLGERCLHSCEDIVPISAIAERDSSGAIVAKVLAGGALLESGV